MSYSKMVVVIVGAFVAILLVGSILEKTNLCRVIVAAIAIGALIYFFMQLFQQDKHEQKRMRRNGNRKNFLPCTIYQSGCPLTGREGQKNVVESNGILRFFCTFRILSYLLYLQYIYRYSYRRAASLALQTLKEK